MKETTVVFENTQSRSEYIKLQENYLDLPSSIVRYTLGVYQNEEKTDDGKPCITVQDFCDALTLDELRKYVSWDDYKDFRFEFDYVKNGLVLFIS